MLLVRQLFRLCYSGDERERERRDGYGGDERERDTGFGSSRWVPQVLMCAYHVNKKERSLSLLKNRGLRDTFL